MRRSTLNTVWNPRGDNEAPHPPYGLLGEDRSKCQSPSLRLEKYVCLGDNSKKDEIDAVVKCHSDHAAPIPTFEPKGAVPFVAKLRSRLIVNQAGGILENAGLCLHPHFGAPYIPGSAVKGIARHAAWCEWKEAWCQWEEAKKQADDEAKVAQYETEVKKIANQIADVFGYPTGDKDGLDTFLAEHGWKEKSQSGSIAFLPAIPVPQTKKKDGTWDMDILVTDLVNCHHPRYYGGFLREATDDESPNPQFFPAVKEETEFTFCLAPVRHGGDLKQAKDWLVAAITVYGAGAKTSAGYGWFDYFDPKTVVPNQSLIDAWEQEYKSNTQQKKAFLQLPEIKDRSGSPEFLRSAVRFIRTRKWWDNEKNNTNGTAARFVSEMVSKFNLEDSE